MARKTYVLFGIDMETDVGSFTPFYNYTKSGTKKILDIYAKHGVKGTFFFTGECAKENPEAVKMVLDAGCEVGVHSLYHETVGDELFNIPGTKPLLPEEVPLRVKRAVEWVESVAGVKTVSWRCPRLWSSTAVCNALEDLGFLSDASYPMYFYRERFAPYHPSRADWTKEGDMKLLEIPIFADMTMESHDPGLERDRDQWPLFRTESAEALYERILGYEKFAEDKNVPCVLNFYFHPWEFEECKTEYHYGEGGVLVDEFIVKGTGKKAEVEFDKLIGLILGEGDRQFVRADELARNWAEWSKK